jgi:hypothetical protein
MAIKVSGTTVIDDSRQLTNIASVDATTVAALSSAGVGAGGGLVSLTSDGAIDARDPVILTATGKVASVAEAAPDPNDTELISSGNENIHYIWHTSESKYVAIYYDSPAILYKVGTPNANGTVTWTSAANLQNFVGSDFAAAYNVADNKIVLCHQEQTGNGPYIRTYTLSGTTLTQTGSVNANHTGVMFIHAVYHPYSGCVCFAYAEGYSTGTQYWVIAINSTGNTPSISQGYRSGNYQALADMTADPDSDNVFVTYREAQVGRDAYIEKWSVNQSRQVAGLSYSHTVGNYNWIPMGMSYDTNQDKVVASFRDNNNSSVMKWVVWNNQSGAIGVHTSSVLPNSSNPLVLNDPVSGSVISFRKDGNALKKCTIDVSSGFSEGTETTIIASGVTDLAPDQTVHDNFSGRATFTYKSNSSGTEVTRGRQVTTPVSNLTSTNLLGISNETQADGQTTEIAIIGSVVDGFTGLTIGSNYYVQEDGTITTSTGGQLIGKAISATQLLITQV